VTFRNIFYSLYLVS